MHNFKLHSVVSKRDRNGAGIRGEESGRGIGAGTDYGGARRGGEKQRRGGAGRGEIMTERSGAGIQLNPRNFSEFEFY